LIVVKARILPDGQKYCSLSPARLSMDLLSNPVFAIVPFAIWVGLIIVAVSSLAAPDDGFVRSFRSARDTLDAHLTRGDIDREEYVDRRRGLDYVTAFLR
jgi:hypothetical protein